MYLFLNTDKNKARTESLEIFIMIIAKSILPFLLRQLAIMIKKTGIYDESLILYEKITGYIFGRIRVRRNRIYIKGINSQKFLMRVNEMFKQKSIDKAFHRNFGYIETLLYNARIFNKKTNIRHIDVPEFFALELINLFEMLEETYGMAYYGAMGRRVYSATWVSKCYRESQSVQPVDTSVLDTILDKKYKLKPHQLEFIQKYPVMKAAIGMRGVLLSFDQGLGKTLTSIALSAALGKQCVLIICPNTLRENWKREIESYLVRYTKNPDLAPREIYVHKISKVADIDQANYLIFNQESLDHIMSSIPKNKVDMLIIDESHNFRNMSGTRTEKIIELLNLLRADVDVLPMSGTPIKAAPGEIAPMLTLLDPRFDIETGKMFSKIFDVDTDSTSRLIETRFKMLIYRKLKSQVLDLPPKSEGVLSFGVKDYERYRLDNIKSMVNEKFAEIWAEELPKRSERMEMYIQFIKQYSRAGDIKTSAYILVVQTGLIDSGRDKSKKRFITRGVFHELTNRDIDEFPKKYVLPYLDKEQTKEFTKLHTEFINIRTSCMSRSIGAVYPKQRTAMYCEMIEQNVPQIVDRINSATKKTIIFSTMLEVVDRAHTLLDPIVGSVKIVGGNSGQRFSEIDKFKYSDDIEVLCATSQTLSTGVTLVEANQIIFFGTPWRSADYHQASDRVHRIGQTHPVQIWIASLPDTMPNLSSRMTDILQWSSQMFGSMIDDNVL
jgi:SNF2 family DNA or RNA helicase